MLQSRYLKMPDGADLAVDVLLPPTASKEKGEGRHLPAIFFQCRYMRAASLRSRLAAPLPALWGGTLEWHKNLSSGA